MKKKYYSSISKAFFTIFLSFLASEKNCFSQPYPPIPATDAYFYQTVPYPNNNVADWGGDDWGPNGIAHTDNYWVICSISRDPGTKKVNNLNYGIWKIPVSYDLINQATASGVITFNKNESNIDTVFKKYGHAGDIDVCISPMDNRGYIVVPLTSIFPGRKPIIGFFRADNLQFINYAYLNQSETDSEQSDIGWCAVSPVDGRLYTSRDDATHLKKYKIQWDTIINQPNNHQGLIRTDNYMGLVDEWGLPLILTDMQGGEFTEDGELLYISSGVMDCNATDGLHVFRHVGNSWKRIKRSGNPLQSPILESCFQLPQDCSSYPYAVENEGLTIWDLSNVQAHSSISGSSSLHVLQVNHSFWTSSSEYIRHYRSISAGSAIFESREPFDADRNPEDLQYTFTGDINGDGKSDLIFPFFKPGSGLAIRTQISQGDGTYDFHEQIFLNDGNYVFDYPTLVGDVNGDSMTDLIFRGQDWNGNTNLNVRVKISNGDGTFTSYSQILGDGAMVHQNPVLTGDVNGDRMTDLIFLGQDWNGNTNLNVRVKMSNGNGTFTEYEQVLGDGAGVHDYPTLTGDVNGDSMTDLIFVGQDWEGDNNLNVRVKMSNGDGTFTSYSQALGDGPGVHQYPTLTGDVNGDGKTDLIFVGQDWNGNNNLNVRVKMSNGDGTFTPYEAELGDGNGVFSYPTLTGDVDGDGKTDLIFVGQNWDGCGLNIRVKRSNGDGTWCEKWQVLGDVPEVHMNSTLANDVNGDGKTDVSFTYIPFRIDLDTNTIDLPPRLRISTKISQSQPFSQCFPKAVYYRTRQSGNWNEASTWESSRLEDFSSDVKSPAPLTPDGHNAKCVIIRNQHTVLVTESVTSPKTVVNSEGNLDILPGVNITVLQ